jgi:transposase
MGRKPQISQKLAEKAKYNARTANNAHELRKAQAVLLPALFSLDLVATAIAIGRSKASVCRLQAEFRSECTSTHIAPQKRGGRRRQNISLEQETQLLEPFFQKMRQGKPLVVAEIRNAYETATGKKVPASTVYRMLARHGWRPQLGNRSTDPD